MDEISSLFAFARVCQSLLKFIVLPIIVLPVVYYCAAMEECGGHYKPMRLELFGDPHGRSRREFL